MQQVGGSLGLAVLVAVFGTAYRDAIAHPVAGLSAVAEQHHVLSHGMSTAFGLAAIFDVVTLALIVVLLKGRAPRPAVASFAADNDRDRVRVPDTAEVHELND
jgi:F0F1-type ATP synthase membrane subunit c/vacuolar-type H+-ATPase subunit K